MAKNENAGKNKNQSVSVSENKVKPIASEGKKGAPRRDLSNVNPELTDAFIQEVDEDVKNDNMKEFFKRYGLLVVSVVVLAVSAAVSFDKFQNWKMVRNQRNTENYMLAAQGIAEAPEKTLESLQNIVQNGDGIFRDFARLQIANVLFDMNKNDEALATLESLVADKSANEEARNVALVKVATYQVDNMSQDDFKALLEPLNNPEGSWWPVAQDLLALSALKNGDTVTARQIYQDLLKNKNLSENFRSKVQDMLSSISDM